MLKRKALDRFFFWKENKTKQALLVTGARQVGKTYLIRQFLEANYSSFAEFNLASSESLKKTFANAKDSSDLMLRISLSATGTLVPHETAIFIDEVQECPEIMTQIKFLVDEGEYDFVLSGSLLGVQLENIRSLPLGYVTEVKMYPLDFEEFCWATGIPDQAFPLLRDSFEQEKTVPDYLHERMMHQFHRYVLTGGMPDAVNAFLLSGTIDQVRVVQEGILSYYGLDITKYAPKNHRLAIRNIFELIPSELNGSSKRFKFSSIEGVKRFNQVTDQFLWLTNAGVALAVYSATQPIRPLLISQQSNRLKLFFSDVGLLTSTSLKQVSVDLLDGKTNMNVGGVYENVVAQELNAHGFSLYYHLSRKIGELDFVVEKRDGSVVVFEVKSGGSYKTHAALNNALAVYGEDISKAYVLAETNVLVEGNVTYLPMYMVSLFSYDE